MTIEFNNLQLTQNNGYLITEDFSGLFGFPVITQAGEKSTDDGGVVFFQKHSSRILQFKVLVFGSDSTQFRSRIEQLFSSFKINTKGYLKITENGTTKQVYGVVGELPTLVYKQENQSQGVFKIQFLAFDPFFISETQKSSSWNLAIPGGFSIPFDLSFNIDSETGGTTTVTNSGNHKAKTKIIIYGDCLNPKITNQTTGQEFFINASISAGDYVVVEKTQDKVSVLLNNTTNYFDKFVGDLSDFIDIEPGNNTLKFSASSYSSQARAEVYFYDTYLHF